MQKCEFKEIYNQYGKCLYSFIIWLTNNRSAADDILQNVFINVWRSQSVPSCDEELKRWLFTIARNASLDYFRKVNRFSRFRTNYKNEYNPPSVDPDAHFVWDEMSFLSENEKTILYLHLKVGYTYKEIGDMMEITENLVRVRAFRALKKSRENLIKKEI